MQKHETAISAHGGNSSLSEGPSHVKIYICYFHDKITVLHGHEKRQQKSRNVGKHIVKSMKQRFQRMVTKIQRGTAKQKEISR